MAIIGINGKIGSGKDLTANIIQYLTSECGNPNSSKHRSYQEFLNKGGGYTPRNFDHHYVSDWQIKKFADKLKDMVCLLIGCTREQLEDQEFKNTELGEEWKRYYLTRGKDKNFSSGYNSFNWNNNNKYFNTEQEAFSKKEELCLHLEELFPEWWEVKSELLTPRLLLQLLGTECGRDIIHPNIWVNSLMSKYKPLNEKVYDTYLNDQGNIAKKEELIYPSWCITDMRFTNELEAVKARGGVSIRVVRNNDPKYSDEQVKSILKNMGYVDLSDGVWEELAINEGFTWFEKIKLWTWDETDLAIESLHPSETALDNAEFDYEIFNDGTIEDLIEKVKEILINEKII